MSVALLVLLAVSTDQRLDVRSRCASSACDWVEKLHTYSSDLVLILVVVHVLGVLTDVRAAEGKSGARDDHRPKARHATNERNYFAVAFSRNFTSASRSSAEPMVCSGILVPGV